MRKARFTEDQMVKILTIIDEWTRESLEIDVQGSIRSGRVIEVLSRLISVHGAPRYLRSDNGPEFVSRAVLKWLHQALQRQVSRRVPEHGMVSYACRSKGRHRKLAPAL